MLSTDADRASPRDTELWLAMHEDCHAGCDGCVGMNLELDEDMLRFINLAAYFLGRPVDVFVLDAVMTAAEDVLVGA